MEYMAEELAGEGEWKFYETGKNTAILLEGCDACQLCNATYQMLLGKGVQG